MQVPVELFLWRVSVSSSDRASGATLRVTQVYLEALEFQYPRRIEPLVQPVAAAPRCSAGSWFQYPRRIEPLVQRTADVSGAGDAGCFSILVGSSLWCNLPGGAVRTDGAEGFSILVGSSLWCNLRARRSASFTKRSFSILVGSSLWCNKLVRVEDGYAYVVSVSSSDRASGATRSTWPSSTSTIHVSVSSSDRASGATPPVPPCPRLYPGFQYPRRIEPLVQPTNVPVRSTSIACFSILVGSSLWCNLVAAELDKQQVYVSVSSSDRASGATEGGERWPVLVHLFQYPRRIEPLVQPADR